MNSDEKAEALEREVSGMLSMLPGKWSVIAWSIDTEYFAAIKRYDKWILIITTGSTKAEALEKLLEKWQKGQLKPSAPAAGSIEELKLKLAIEKG